jgi:hypothetical protein
VESKRTDRVDVNERGSHDVILLCEKEEIETFLKYEWKKINFFEILVKIVVVVILLLR